MVMARCKKGSSQFQVHIKPLLPSELLAFHWPKQVNGGNWNQGAGIAQLHGKGHGYRDEELGHEDNLPRCKKKKLEVNDNTVKHKQ